MKENDPQGVGLSAPIEDDDIEAASKDKSKAKAMSRVKRGAVKEFYDEVKENCPKVHPTALAEVAALVVRIGFESR